MCCANVWASCDRVDNERIKTKIRFKLIGQSKFDKLPKHNGVFFVPSLHWVSLDQTDKHQTIENVCRNSNQNDRKTIVWIVRSASFRMAEWFRVKGKMLMCGNSESRPKLHKTRIVQSFLFLNCWGKKTKSALEIRSRWQIECDILHANCHWQHANEIIYLTPRFVSWECFFFSFAVGRVEERSRQHGARLVLNI